MYTAQIKKTSKMIYNTSLATDTKCYPTNTSGDTALNEFKDFMVYFVVLIYQYGIQLHFSFEIIQQCPVESQILKTKK